MTREEFDEVVLPLIEIHGRTSDERRARLHDLVFACLEDMPADEPSLDLLTASAVDWAWPLSAGGR